MTAATETSVTLEREHGAALEFAIKLHLLGLGLDGEAEDRLGISSEPNVVAIERLGRRLVLCSDVLQDLEHRLTITVSEEVVWLLHDLIDDTMKSEEQDAKSGTNPDDAVLVTARRVYLQVIQRAVQGAIAGGEQ